MCATSSPISASSVAIALWAGSGPRASAGPRRLRVVLRVVLAAVFFAAVFFAGIGLTLVAPALRRSSAGDVRIAQLSREATDVRADTLEHPIDLDFDAAPLEVPPERRDVAGQQIVRGGMS